MTMTRRFTPAGFVPIYPLTMDISQRYLRRLIKQVVDAHAADVEEFVPAEIIGRQALLPLYDALRNVHFPADSALIEQARKRLIFNEFFLLQLLL